MKPSRVLETSAYTENAIVHQVGLNDGVALLQKPFTSSALAHKVREVLDQPGAPKPDRAQKTFGLTITCRVMTDKNASQPGEPDSALFQCQPGPPHRLLVGTGMQRRVEARNPC